MPDRKLLHAAGQVFDPPSALAHAAVPAAASVALRLKEPVRHCKSASPWAAQAGQEFSHHKQDGRATNQQTEDATPPWPSHLS